MAGCGMDLKLPNTLLWFVCYLQELSLIQKMALSVADIMNMLDL